ncbi:hypothetical protein IF803_36710 [Bradyrhizobium sp. UFLA06-06]
MAKKSEPTLYDKIAAVHPRYRDLLLRQRELLDRAEEIKREIGGNRSQWRTTVNAAGNVTGVRFEESLGAEAVRNHTPDDDTPRRPQQKPEPDERREAAKALLGNLLPEQQPEELSPKPLPKRWPGQDRYSALAKESESINVALGYISPLVEEARREYSKKIAEQRIGDYSELVKQAVDAACALESAIIQIRTFLNTARLDGAELRHFRPVYLETFGDLGEGSLLHELIADAVRKKHVGAGKLLAWTNPGPIELLN